MTDDPYAEYSKGWAPPAPKQATGPDPYAEWVTGDKSAVSESMMPAAIADIPSETSKAASAAWAAIKEGFMPSKGKAEQGVLGGQMATGRALAAIPALAMSPVTGLARSVGGHLLAGATHAAGTLINPEVAAREDQQQLYETAAGQAETALSAMAPARGGLPAWKSPTPIPAPPPPGPLGVTLSEGQATGALPLIRKEQAALREQLGQPAAQRAEAFKQQQTGQVEAATEGVARSFDPFGARVVETPQQAGAVVSQSMQRAQQQARAGVKAEYQRAEAYGGEVHAGAFEGFAQKVKTDLTNRPEPIVIDEKLTPHANQALKDVENRISNLIIQNRADWRGQPDPQNIVGVTLKGVDQMRRRLSTFRRDAFSNSDVDGRAAQAVIDSFDDRVNSAINGGLFRGDPRAIDAWNIARAAHSDYKGTFTAAKNDPIGRVTERILGKGLTPAAIPNDVADFMYGSTGVNPNTLNVNVANRVKTVLGEQSPEWSAVKQGLFSRIIETPPGVTDFGPGRIAQRIGKFLEDGKELSQTVFTSQEIGLIRQYADLQRHLEVPRTGANVSETSTFVAPMLRKLSGLVAGSIGALIGRAVLPGWYGLGEAAGAAAATKVSGSISDIRNARMIAKQMPLLSEQMAKWQKAYDKAVLANSPPSRKALTAATANVSRTLSNMGIDTERANLFEGAP